MLSPPLYASVHVDYLFAANEYVPAERNKSFARFGLQINPAFDYNKR